jgi:hypothetical protein
MEFNKTLVVRIEKAEAVESDEFIGVFEGVASTPDVDLDNDRFAPEVLARNAEQLVGKPILVLHGKGETGNTPVGKILEAKFENGMLKIKAGIFKTFSNVWEKIKSGVYKALSIGGIAKALRKLGNGIREILDAEIHEVSLAPRGKNPNAQILFAFGKAFVENEAGELVEFDESLYKSIEFEKVDYDLPIVERGSWDGNAAAKRILDWAEREDGKIDKSKASKLFLVVEGDGENRTDYSWPVGDIVDGKPVLVTSGIRTAIVYAAGARGVKAPPEVKRALERLVARLKREGYLDEDYEVPWKREEKAEDDVLKSLAAMVMEMREEIRKFMGVRVEKAEDAIKEENKSEKNEAQASANTESVTVKVESPKAQVSGVEPRPKAEEWALEEARRVIRRIFEQY